MRSAIVAISLILLSACDAASDATQAVQGEAADFAVGSAAKDQIEVYEIAKRNGDKMQTCMQAMAIAQLFLQSKNEASWKEWKAVEKADCEAAGMPVTS